MYLFRLENFYEKDSQTLKHCCFFLLCTPTVLLCTWIPSPPAGLCKLQFFHGRHSAYSVRSHSIRSQANIKLLQKIKTHICIWNIPQKPLVLCLLPYICLSLFPLALFCLVITLSNFLMSSPVTVFLFYLHICPFLHPWTQHSLY